MEPVLCYNRGCGKTYHPKDNEKEEAPCQYHPGAPYFHDAYKGWTCCNRKATDFTVFLNFPGCESGKHSNVRPVEPEKITGNLDKDIELPKESSPARTRAPMEALAAKRPDSDSAPFTRLVPKISPGLKRDAESMVEKAGVMKEENGTVTIGESCKNGGCKQCYDGNNSIDEGECQFHPGVPIFHEGMKYWSCCNRKTSDFQSFLDQVGCERGVHKWKKEPPKNAGKDEVECRYDWHQTASKVVVAVYAKKYDPSASTVEVSPVRLKMRVYFPERGGCFNLDLELKGVISVSESSASMLGTKIEVHLHKADAGSWAGLNVPRKKTVPVLAKQEDSEPVKTEPEPELVDALDLDDLELTSSQAVLSKEASGGKTNEPII